MPLQHQHVLSCTISTVRTLAGWIHSLSCRNFVVVTVPDLCQAINMHVIVSDPLDWVRTVMAVCHVTQLCMFAIVYYIIKRFAPVDAYVLSKKYTGVVFQFCSSACNSSTANIVSVVYIWCTGCIWAEDTDHIVLLHICWIGLGLLGQLPGIAFWPLCTYLPTQQREICPGTLKAWLNRTRTC